MPHLTTAKKLSAQLDSKLDSKNDSKAPAAETFEAIHIKRGLEAVEAHLDEYYEEEYEKAIKDMGNAEIEQARLKYNQRKQAHLARYKSDQTLLLNIGLGWFSVQQYDQLYQNLEAQEGAESQKIKQILAPLTPPPTPTGQPNVFFELRDGILNFELMIDATNPNLVARVSSIELGRYLTYVTSDSGYNAISNMKPEEQTLWSQPKLALDTIQTLKATASAAAPSAQEAEALGDHKQTPIPAASASLAPTASGAPGGPAFDTGASTTSAPKPVAGTGIYDTKSSTGTDYKSQSTPTTSSGGSGGSGGSIGAISAALSTRSQISKTQLVDMKQELQQLQRLLEQATSAVAKAREGYVIKPVKGHPETFVSMHTQELKKLHTAQTEFDTQLAEINKLLETINQKFNGAFQDMSELKNALKEGGDGKLRLAIARWDHQRADIAAHTKVNKWQLEKYTAGVTAKNQGPTTGTTQESAAAKPPTNRP